jgi:hypothetical protein
MTKILVSDIELIKICKWISNIKKQKEEWKITYNQACEALRIVIRTTENILEILFNQK